MKEEDKREKERKLSISTKEEKHSAVSSHASACPDPLTRTEFGCAAKELSDDREREKESQRTMKHQQRWSNLQTFLCIRPPERDWK